MITPSSIAQTSMDNDEKTQLVIAAKSKIEQWFQTYVGAPTLNRLSSLAAQETLGMCLWGLGIIPSIFWYAPEDRIVGVSCSLRYLENQEPLGTVKLGDCCE